jgi:hypothetical protein
MIAFPASFLEEEKVTGADRVAWWSLRRHLSSGNESNQELEQKLMTTSFGYESL